MNARIQVGIRLRPFLESEISKGYFNSKIAVDKPGRRISVQSAHGNNSQKVFEFDHIFEQSSQQDKVYADCDVSQLVARVLDGFHSTIFAYGQTGSGKTYTMEGKHEGGVYQDSDQKGIAARALDDLFGQISGLRMSSNKEFSVTCSFLQIYNERIYDLLGAAPGFNGSSTTAAGPPSGVAANSLGTQVQLPAGLKLRWTAREQFQVENLSIFGVKSAKEAQAYFLSGVKNRVTASHKLNMTSSRSHTIFTISVHTFSAEGAHETSAKLQLVDLAGSERISQTGTEGKLAKESIDINKSLFTLRQVITALSEINQASAGSSNGFASYTLSTQDNFSNSDAASHKLQHIPYRESKLTSLLKQSIGGNCYCLMIACIVPSDPFIDENVSTLHYASRATYIRNQPVKNEDPNKQLLAETKNENLLLKAELEKANAHIAFLTSALEKSEKVCAILKQQQQQQQQQDSNAPSDSSKDQIVFMQQQERFKAQKEMQEQQQRILEEKMKQQRGANLPEILQNQIGNSLEMKNIAPSNSNSPAGTTPNGIISTQAQGQPSYQGATSQSFYSAADYDNFSDRLIESITLVRQLLESNKDLRQQTDESKQRMANLQAEVADLTRENQELREQLVYSKTTSSQQFQTQIMSSKQWSTQNSVQRPPRPMDVAPRSLDATTSAHLHPDFIHGNDWEKDPKNHFSVDDNVLPRSSKHLLNKRRDQDDDLDDICQIEPRLETNHSATGYNLNLPPPQQKMIASSTKNSRTENRKISRKELAQESGAMISSHPRIKSQDITDRQGINKLTSNQSSASKPRQHHVFYSASKKRMNSLHQPRQSQQHTSLQNQMDEPNISGQMLLGTSLNASSNNGLSAQAANFMNQTLPESNYLNAQSQQQQWSSASINNTASIIPAIAGNAMDSAPTNFGRYTFYQQNFHNLEKLHSQQMVKIQQQGIVVSEICIPKADTQKFSTGDTSVSRFSINNNLIIDSSKITQDSQLLELNTNHLKRGMILPQTTTAGSFKANRSNSLTKNQMNPSINGNNNTNNTCFNSVFPVTATSAGISINDVITNGNSSAPGQQPKQFVFQQVPSSVLPGNSGKSEETVMRQRSDQNRIKQIARRQAASFSNSNDNVM